MKIDFRAAFGDFFTTKDKWMTLLLLSVCMLIPFVGQIVAYGYFFRRFARIRLGKEADDFTFDRFADYLKIGLWPFLSALVASLVLTPVAMLGVLPMMFAPMLDPENTTMIVGSMIVGMTVYILAITIMIIVTMPVMLRSGLRMDFAEGFSWKFIRSFLGKVGLSLTGWYLLFLLISIPLSMLGMIALYVGLFAVATWMSFASTHLLFQHYDLYLERGGEPIEFAEELVRDFPMALPPLPKRDPPPLPDKCENPP